MKKLKQLGQFGIFGLDNIISIAYCGVVSGFALLLIKALCA